MNRSRFLLAIAFVLAAACTPLSGPQAPTVPSGAPAASLVDTSWQLVSLGPTATQVPPVEGTTITIEFQTDGLVGGSSGCNSYGGMYQVTGDTLVFGQMSSTLVACADERANRQEQDFMQALESAGKFVKNGDQLTIWYDNEQSRMNFVQTTA